MELNEYQELARSTAIYPKEFSVIYPTLGLAGESGEVAEKVKKSIRDNHGEFNKEAIQKELGDVMWYIANIASDLELKLEDIAQMNVAKLKSRQERGVLQGSGDNR